MTQELFPQPDRETTIRRQFIAEKIDGWKNVTPQLPDELLAADTSRRLETPYGTFVEINGVRSPVSDKLLRRLRIIDLARETDETDLWRGYADCLDTNYEPYFPEHGRDNALVRQCKTRCSVIAQCLESALQNDDKGIRGGTTYKERERMKWAIGRAINESAEQLQSPDEGQQLAG